MLIWNSPNEQNSTNFQSLLLIRLLFVTWNIVNGIRLTLNSHISQFMNGFDVVQIGGDSLFQDLSNERSYAQFRWELRKLRLFYKELSSWNFARSGRATSARSGTLSELFGPETSVSLNLVTVQSGDRNFDAGGAISSRILCGVYFRVFVQSSLML